ncbi:hypothetical protein OIE66_11815 [Nonomuraea sp. NBC_01738]|uniref:hypothetical protein n=1 Tax=Nonomuraea sp. NBC_01738 TaxID=2976003 RepID=UPI002E10391D|nr:hypothetical protein OIE66_11815 [Nonomuraea sp. NBC_01738]
MSIPEQPQPGDSLVFTPAHTIEAEAPLPPAPAPMPMPVPLMDRVRPVVGALPKLWRSLVPLLTWIVTIAARLIALVFVLHAAFAIFKANALNTWYQVVESLANSLSLGLTSLFQLSDVRWEVVVNHGLAAVVWLIAGSVITGLLRRTVP